MKKNTTEQRLLDATLKLISEKGYLGSTTREIAQEAGVTELTLFRHFGTKEKLFEALLRNHTFLPRLKELLPELDGLILWGFAQADRIEIFAVAERTQVYGQDHVLGSNDLS